MNSNKNYEGYEKLKTVGQGAFGRATLYRRIHDKKLVVMKEIYTLDMDNAEKNDALNEAQILSTLKHKNIISYYGNFQNDVSLVIIMEYADGGNLAQLINAKKNKNELFTEISIINILRQICSAISYLHANKILHRDLKTANIFLNMNGSVKVGDFGISKMLNTKSQAQTVVGTPYYLSPEMCEGSDYNEKSDIWAIGCILYELASLRKPFEAISLPVLVQKITQCKYADIPSFYTSDLSELVKSILRKDPSLRPSAKYILERVVSKITKELQGLANTPKNPLMTSTQIEIRMERSILYKISNFGDQQKIRPIDLPHKKIIDFSASKTHQIAITSGNMVYTWGDNSSGQLALGKQNLANKGYPACVNCLQQEKITQCAAGSRFSLFLSDSGQVFSCGSGENGCLGHGDWDSLSAPKPISSLINAKITKICCGDDHVIALSSNGSVFSWGSAQEGALGQGHTQFRCKPFCLKLGAKIKAIYCGSDASILVGLNNQIFVSGNNKFHKLGIENNHEKIVSFTLMPNFKETVKFISIGANHTIFLTETENIIISGAQNNNFEGKFLRKIQSVSCGLDFSVALDAKNVLWFWGSFYKKCKNNKNEDPKNKLSNSIVPLDKTLTIKESISQDVIKKESVKIPKCILACFASKENIKLNNIITFAKIIARDDHLFVLVHTTCPPLVNQFTHNTALHNTKQNSTILDAIAVSSLQKLPNIPS